MFLGGGGGGWDHGQDGHHDDRHDDPPYVSTGEPVESAEGAVPSDPSPEYQQVNGAAEPKKVGSLFAGLAGTIFAAVLV